MCILWVQIPTKLIVPCLTWLKYNVIYDDDMTRLYRAQQRCKTPYVNVTSKHMRSGPPFHRCRASADTILADIKIKIDFPFWNNPISPKLSSVSATVLLGCLEYFVNIYNIFASPSTLRNPTQRHPTTLSIRRPWCQATCCRLPQ